MQLGANQQLDRYTVLDMLGQGGMAVVYRLKHNQLDTEHALKVLTLTKPSVRRRLILEGKVQANLRHPNVVTVSDVLNIQGAPGLLMEYIAGPSLEDWLERYRPSLDEIEAVFRGIVKGVAHAHSRDLVHRDLKPGNVMLERHGDHLIPKVADFGLAKAFADSEEEDGGRRRTRTGVAMGTPAYMAPEQIRSAKDVDIRADVYSLGCILYEMVTGQHAFEADDLPSIFEMVLSGSYEPVSSLVPDVPARFLMAIHGAMAIDANKRIPDCETLLEVLSGGQWDLGQPADATWAGSIDMQLVTPKQTLVPPEVSSFPPPDFSFSDEALAASYPPQPKELPSVEEVMKETMGVSLMNAPMKSDGTIDFEALIPPPQQTVIIREGGGWFMRLAAMAIVGLLGLVLFFVARLNPVVQDAIAAVAPEAVARAVIPESGERRIYADEKGIDPANLDAIAAAPTEEEEPEDGPSNSPIVKVEGVTADGEREEVTAKVDMGPKYYVDDEEELPEGVEAENRKEQDEKVLTAEVIVDENDERAGQADLAVQMTTEEIAALPEDRLPAGYGAISITGDADKVWLKSDQGRVEPGLVLAGKYRMMATFGGKEVGAADIHVQTGKKVTYNCDSLFQKCVPATN